MDSSGYEISENVAWKSLHLGYKPFVPYVIADITIRVHGESHDFKNIGLQWKGKNAI